MSRITKKNKFKYKPSHILYLVFMIIMIFVLFFANSIVIKVFNKGFIANEIDGSNLKIKDDVFYYILFTNPMGNILEEFNIDGWALCATEEDNSNKKINVILKSDEHIYSVNTVLSDRADIQASYKDKTKFANHGFGCVFSTINIKDGFYELYIENIENEANYGVVSTGIVLVKDEKGMRRYNPDTDFNSSDSVNLNSTDTEGTFDSKLKYALNSEFKITDNKLLIDGWGFVEGFDAKNQKVYVEFYDENKNKINTYSTYQYSRPRVAQLFNDNKYQKSGFKANIPFNGSEKENLYLRIIIENNQKLYYSNYIARKPIVFNISEQTTVDTKEYLNGTQLCFEQTFPLEDNCFIIGGWGFVDNLDSLNQKIYLYIVDESGNTKYYDTYQYEREGVATLFKNINYVNSGFKSKIPISELPLGELEMGLIIDNNGIYKTKSIKVLYKDGSIIYLK